MFSKEQSNALKRTARIVAVLTLVMTLFAIFSMLDVPGLSTPEGAETTSDLAFPSARRLRLNIVSDSIICLIEIVLTVMLYVLLKPVNQTLSLVAAVARLAMTALQGVNLLNRLVAAQILSGTESLTAFEPEQVRSLARLFLDAHQSMILVWGLFFALHLAVLGYLVYKSGYIPRVLGIVLLVASLAYFVQDWGTILFPQYAEALAAVGFLSIIEIAFPVWLLIKGVRDRPLVAAAAG